MSSSHKRTIIEAFSAAARTYEAEALVQVRAANTLSQLALAPPLAAAPRVLEVGCGTGLLTRRLLAATAGGSFLVTDLSPAMVEQTRTVVRDPRCRFRVMDGELPDLEPGSVDLVVSSLAAQWFDELHESLARLARCLAPGGRLAVSLLGEASFVEWKAAVAGLGLDSGMPDYPEASVLAAMLPTHGGSVVTGDRFTVDYADGRVFLAALKAIGANTPKAGYKSLPPGSLRRAIAALGAPCAVTWDVLYAVWEKPE